VRKKPVFPRERGRFVDFVDKLHEEAVVLILKILDTHGPTFFAGANALPF
jgi:hypothetical protein